MGTTGCAKLTSRLVEYTVGLLVLAAAIMPQQQARMAAAAAASTHCAVFPLTSTPVLLVTEKLNVGDGGGVTLAAFCKKPETASNRLPLLPILAVVRGPAPALAAPALAAPAARPAPDSR